MGDLQTTKAWSKPEGFEPSKLRSVQILQCYKHPAVPERGMRCTVTVLRHSTFVVLGQHRASTCIFKGALRARPMAAAVGSIPTAAAAAAAATATSAGSRPRMAVVGAGFAGLAAALTLQRSGCCDVVVLEAGNRPGGRACTQPLSQGLAWELGATWFHGLGDAEEPNPVFWHAVQQGLIESDPSGEQWWSSQFLLPGVHEPLSKEQQIAVAHTLAAWVRTVEGLPHDAQGTTAQHLERAWEQLMASGKVAPDQVELAQRAWRWRELLQRAMDGCDSTADQSAQGLALYDEMPGGVHSPLPAGMQTVAERLAAQLADVRFGHEVELITWGGPASSSGSGGSAAPGGAGGDCQLSGGSRHVSITCANGARLEADAIVVTVSLGVLKARHARLFRPPLPPFKAAAIQRLRIGTVDKLLLDFAAAPAAAGDGAGAGAGAPAGDGCNSGTNAAAAGAATAAVLGAAASITSGGGGSDTVGGGPVVSYALLWSRSWMEEDSSNTASGPAAAGASAAAAAAGAAAGASAVVAVVGAAAGASGAAAAVGAAAGARHAVPVQAAAAEGELPGWANGIFSLRFGGPEVKRTPLQAQQQPLPPQQPQQVQPPMQQPQQQPQKSEMQQQPQQQAAPTEGRGESEGQEEKDTTEECKEEVEEESEYNPCAEAAQPRCYQAVAWVTGAVAAGMEAASDAEVLRALRQLGAAYPQLQLPPGASWDAVTLHRSRWGSDPLFRGSYSYLGPDCSPADVAALAAPLTASAAAAAAAAGTSEGAAEPSAEANSNATGSSSSNASCADQHVESTASSACSGGSDSSSGGGSSTATSSCGGSSSSGGGSSDPPVLLFAGEACHVKYIGTMHGAYLTGQRAAKQLLLHLEQTAAA